MALVLKCRHGLVDPLELIYTVIEYRDSHSSPFFPPFVSFRELAID
ncbi:MAG TPA: hypothetical protein VF555_03915 [Variovorax sp.]